MAVELTNGRRGAQMPAVLSQCSCDNCGCCENNLVYLVRPDGGATEMTLEELHNNGYHDMAHAAADLQLQIGKDTSYACTYLGYCDDEPEQKSSGTDDQKYKVQQIVERLETYKTSFSSDKLKTDEAVRLSETFRKDTALRLFFSARALRNVAASSGKMETMKKLVKDMKDSVKRSSKIKDKKKGEILTNLDAFEAYF